MTTSLRNFAEASAPGRVCIAGEDIDWLGKGGPSILCAVNLRTKATIRPKSIDDGIVTFKTGEPFNQGLDVPLGEIGKYTGSVLDYAHASLKVITDLGVTPKAMTLDISSDLPSRAGLSSSAAVSVASLAALAEFYELNLSDEEIAALAYKVEREEVKTGAGQMDMYSSALGGLIYLNSATVPPHSIETYQLPENLDIIIVDSETPRNTRDVLRDKQKRYDSGEPNILTYMSETNTAIEQIRSILALQPIDVDKLGSLISACHVYMRDFLQVSTKLIDECVDISTKNGAVGAKLTGTGMGGCLFAIVPREMTDKIVSALQETSAKVIVTSPARRGIEKSSK